MKAITIKNWCDTNISPLAWQRIVMKNLDAFKNMNLSIAELNNPTEAITIDQDLYDLIKKTIKEMYQVEYSINS